MFHSYDEWSDLQEIIVGNVRGSIIPTVDQSLRNFMYANLSIEKIKEIIRPYDKMIIEESIEDLDNLSNKLTELGVKVYRPADFDHQNEIRNSYWSTTGWSNFCPRDIMLILGDVLIEVPSPMRSRIFEVHAYHDILYHFMKTGGKWISSPRPKIKDDSFQFDNLKVSTLKNKEILFDAANVIRMGKDILYQVSNSGNIFGYEWLKSIFPKYNIHLVKKSYSGAHLDSTIIPIKPGLVLFNSNRVFHNSYPEYFKNWDKIFFNDIVDTKSFDYGISTSAIGLNILSVNENLVIVDENQTPLMKKLKSFNIESIPMKMRHSRILGGGFHCVTLDLRRKGNFESYY